MIRKAKPRDLRRIQDIEVAAVELFRGIGMDAIADDPPPSQDELMAYQHAGRVWVATDPADHPIAYILVHIVEGGAHIEQVTVHPRHSRKGLGSTLIEFVTRWAREKGFNGMTLTTFRDVPWNAPYYERLGFRQLPQKEWSDGLRKIVQRENQHGLDDWPRVVLIKDLQQPVASIA